MGIGDSVAFVTGPVGDPVWSAQELLAAGARKVYCAARRPERITLDGVERVRLDVTDPSGSRQGCQMRQEFTSITIRNARTRRKAQLGDLP